MTTTDEEYKTEVITCYINNYDGSEQKPVQLEFESREAHGQYFVNAIRPDVKLDDLYRFSSEKDALKSIEEDILISLAEHFNTSERYIILNFVQSL